MRFQYMKTLPLLFFILSFISLPAQVQPSGYKEIKAKNEKYDFKGTPFLKEELKDVDIILLGEPVHSHLFYPVKIQLVKYLHEEFGFDVLAFESGLFQMEKVNEDIKNGEEVFSAFDKGLFPIWTSTFEFEELYNYLDSLRSAGSPLEITGFDCQVSSTNASQRFVPELEEALKKNNITFEKETLRILQTQLDSLEAIKGLTQNFNDESLKQLWNLEKATRSIKDMSLLHQSLLGFIGHFTDLYKNKLLQKLRKGQFTPSDSNVRDSLMAMQAIYLYKQLYPGKKIIVWAANLHLANHVSKLKNYPFETYRPMGYHLKKELGDKVFFLATTTDWHQPGTIEWQLGKQPIDGAWFPRNALAKDSISTISLIPELTAKNKLENIMDGILYFNSRPEKSKDVTNAYALKGKVVDASTRLPIEFASVMITGTTRGVASEENGEFFLKTDSIHRNGMLTISCIGYASRRVSIAQVLKANGAFTVSLSPDRELLKEVVISAKPMDAKEILLETFRRIPENYTQSPFNMQFHSVLTVQDTTDHQEYSLETVFESYSDGYLPKGRKNYQVIQKRERGNYFMKDKYKGMAMWPVVEVAFNEVYSTQLSSPIFSPDQLDKVNIKLAGTKLYNQDTVFILTYDFQLHGEFYISWRDYAIVKHTTTSVSRSYRNRMEIVYKKEGSTYFPFEASGDYLHLYKVDRKKKFLKISNRVILKSIEQNNVTPFEANYDLWHSKNITYDKVYWDTHYPRE